MITCILSSSGNRPSSPRIFPLTTLYLGTRGITARRLSSQRSMCALERAHFDVGCNPPLICPLDSLLHLTLCLFCLTFFPCHRRDPGHTAVCPLGSTVYPLSVPIYPLVSKMYPLFVCASFSPPCKYFRISFCLATTPPNRPVTSLLNNGSKSPSLPLLYLVPSLRLTLPAADELHPQAERGGDRVVSTGGGGS